MIALKEAECCALAGTDCRPLLLRRRASRPQLKRDPLGAHEEADAMRVPGRHLIAASLIALPIAAISAQQGPKRDVPLAMRSVLHIVLNQDSALSIVGKLGPA